MRNSCQSIFELFLFDIFYITIIQKYQIIKLIANKWKLEELDRLDYDSLIKQNRVLFFILFLICCMYFQ